LDAPGVRDGMLGFGELGFGELGRSHPSPLGLRRRNILRERKRARKCLTDQEERMVFELQAGNIGDIVALQVPTVDRGRWTLATSRSHHR